MALIAGLTISPFVSAGNAYFGVGLGQSKFDPEQVFSGIDDFVDLINDAGGSASYSSEGDSLKIFAGNRINPNLSIEGGFLDMGEVFKDTFSYGVEPFLNPFDLSGSDTVEVDGLYFAFIGRTPLSERISFNTRLGLYKWDASFKSDIIATTDSGTFPDSYSESLDGNDIFYGISLDIGIVSLQYERYTFTDGSFDTDIDYIGVALKFGS